MNRQKNKHKSNEALHPPRLAEWLLAHFISHEIRTTALGDFDEIYQLRQSEFGSLRANVWYWLQMIKSLPAFIIDQIYWRFVMFANYLKIAYRNFSKRKAYSFINITGMVLSIACSIFILAYIEYEFSYDTFHENAPNIYRVASSGKVAGRAFDIALTPAPMAPAMQSDFPEVVNFVRLRGPERNMIGYKNNRFYEQNFLYADQSIFEIFSFNLVTGDRQNALSVPYSMVMTEELARKYFGDEDPIGKIVKLNSVEDFTVTGILEKVPENSHVTFDCLASFSTIEKRDPQAVAFWFNWNYYTYVLLQENIDHKEVDAKLLPFIDKYIGKELKAFGAEFSGYLQPLLSIHLHSNMEEEIASNSDIRYIYIFIAIAFVVLIMACINFMNLSTARSANRAKEVGIRKVLGTNRHKLIGQFLGESFSFAFLSLLLAMIFVKIALPLLNNFAGREITIDYFQQPWLLLSLIIIVVFMGLMAGIYPAFYLSRFKPVSVLKGDVSRGAKNSRFRSILVVAQFAISITLIIGTNTIFNQLHFLVNKRLGFNKEQLLVIPLQDDQIRGKLTTLKSEMTSLDGVLHAAGSRMAPGDENMNVNGYLPEGYESNKAFLMENFYIDDDFLDTYELHIVQGRNFSKEIITDKNEAVLINETAVKKLGWENPIGKKVYFPLDQNDMSQRGAYTVIGVYNDFHHRSLYRRIEPSLLDFSPDYARKLTLKLKADNIVHTMQLVKQKWSEINPNHPYEYYFLDESFDSQYRREQKLGDLVRIFTIFAIFIGCLGLLGLASYTSEQRTKEIGIRKVLGASTQSIITIFLKEFIRWVLVANIIAWPTAYFVMRKWLENFAYKTELGIELFLYSTLIALVIAVATVSYQAIRSAFSNPVDSLRYE